MALDFLETEKATNVLKSENIIQTGHCSVKEPQVKDANTQEEENCSNLSKMEKDCDNSNKIQADDEEYELKEDDMQERKRVFGLCSLDLLELL